ncbi:MAG: type II CRISPR RNA-guided endonuclease Cas9, partial [candidate division NC10 bacterium RIFCSPLOWO2_12_FULL_66_18]
MDRPPLVLGLDLGTNSIGWALLETDKGEPSGLAGCGARIFQEAVDAQKGTPKNAKRRQARQARKLVSRRKMRRAALVNLLAHHDLLPKEPDAREALLRTLDPYLLRKRGLDEPLTLHEFGRAIFHLNQRRGFQSNRKTALGILAGHPEFAALIQAEEARKAAGAKKKKAQDDEEDEGIVMAAITEIRRAMADSGARTIGEYLFSLPQKRNRFSEQGRYTDRAMYKEEFEALWNAQAPHHPGALTDDLKVKVHDLIFSQRPLKPQKFLIGKCQFERGKKRAPWARPEAQRFRYLQDVNHLEVKDPITRMMRPLTLDQRGKIAAKLEEQETMTWGGVRKLLKLHGGETFNIEEGGKEKVIGNRTGIKLRNALPGFWDGLPPEKQEAFVEDLLSIRKKEVLLKRLRGHWGLSAEQAYAVLTQEFQPGYASLSLKAIHKLLPHLENGLNYHDACQAAGYERDDQKEIKAVDRLPLPPRLRNPVVQKCLHEVRKVVNAVIRKWGKPDLIRVELARDMKLTKKQKESLDRQNR